MPCVRFVPWSETAYRPRSGLLLGLLLYCVASPGAASEKEWIALRGPLFDVVSQVGEKETRRWATEFDQFIDVLHRVYSVDERKLTPLTIVLFENARGFGPYRPVTESGQAQKVDGLFGRRANWSVIGLAGSRGSTETRRVIQHEAVHWFFSAHASELPLWLGEGIAEVFSTFEVKAGKGQLGEAIPEHVAYLNHLGLLPLEEFFRVSQDEALHENKRFYPQSWAFVHYCMYGNGGAERDKLTTFQRLIETEPGETAFRSAFGQTYAEADQALKRYLDGGHYSVGVLELVDRNIAFTVGPASETQVDFALARLALVAGNLELADRQAAAMIDRLPESPEGYEILAQSSFSAGDQERARRAASRAVDLGSTDAGLYLIQAQLMLHESQRSDAWIDQLIDPDQARAIADTLTRSLALQPRNPSALAALVAALLNVAELTAEDQRTLDAGQRVLPRSGLMLVVRAAAANRAGDLKTARTLLREARSVDRELPPDFRRATSSLGERWTVDRLSADLQDVRTAEDLDAFDAMLAEAMAFPGQSGQLHDTLQQLVDTSRSFRRYLEASEAADDGDFGGARDLLQAIIDDPDAGKGAKVNAEEALRALPD